MITFGQYRKVLASLSAQGIRAVRIDQLVENRDDPKLFLLKHDVEAALPLALKLARIEAECGHHATYYFQGDLLLQDGAAAVVREIANLGHEAAYHYDVLDSCDGDYATATREFDRYKALIEELSGQALRTVCPHGNPTKVRNGWRSNKDFFRSEDVRRLYPEIIDIVVDFAELLSGGVYLSDAGFMLRRIGNIGGNDLSNEAAIADGTVIDWPDLGRLVIESDGVLLSVHSHRLRDSALSLFLLRARIVVLRTGYRVAKNIPFVKTIASKFYVFARRL